LILKGGMMIPNGWSADGHLLFMDLRNPFAPFGVYSAARRQRIDDASSRLGGLGGEAQFSPDGKWFAYKTLGGGQVGGDVFVRPFPGPGARIQVSNAGGGQPRWSHDGTRIFYIQPDKKLMEARFDTRTGSAAAPRVLFQTRIVAANFVLFQYDVSPDGRFLINSLPANSPSPLTLITGWTAALKER
jgi:Tol biopolymer transport system component